LHLLSGLHPAELLTDVMLGMCRVAKLILEHGADTTKKDAQGNNCLHRAILSDNIQVFRELLKANRLALNDRNKDDHVPLWLALQQAEQMRKFILIFRCILKDKNRTNCFRVLPIESRILFDFCIMIR
jgi:ankyrin repeat protein